MFLEKESFHRDSFHLIYHGQFLSVDELKNLCIRFDSKRNNYNIQGSQRYVEKLRYVLTMKGNTLIPYVVALVTK